MKLIAANVKITVSEDEVFVDIYVNNDGNLVLKGIGSVNYGMDEEEIYFMRHSWEKKKEA